MSHEGHSPALIDDTDYDYLARNISDAFIEQSAASSTLDLGLDYVLKLDQADQEYDLLPPYYTTSQNLDAVLAQTTNFEQVTLALQNHVVNRGNTTIDQYYEDHGLMVTEEFALISAAVGFTIDPQYIEPSTTEAP